MPFHTFAIRQVGASERNVLLEASCRLLNSPKDYERLSQSAQTTLTEYHRLGGLNNGYLFLEAGSWKSRCQHGQELMRLSSWLTDGHLLAVTSPGRERESKLSGVSS